MSVAVIATFGTVSMAEAMPLSGSEIVSAPSPADRLLSIWRSPDAEAIRDALARVVGDPRVGQDVINLTQSRNDPSSAVQTTGEVPSSPSRWWVSLLSADTLSRAKAIDGYEEFALLLDSAPYRSFAQGAIEVLDDPQAAIALDSAGAGETTASWDPGAILGCLALGAAVGAMVTEIASHPEDPFGPLAAVIVAMAIAMQCGSPALEGIFVCVGAVGAFIAIVGALRRGDLLQFTAALVALAALGVPCMVKMKDALVAECGAALSGLTLAVNEFKNEGDNGKLVAAAGVAFATTLLCLKAIFGRARPKPPPQIQPPTQRIDPDTVGKWNIIVEQDENKDTELLFDLGDGTSQIFPVPKGRGIIEFPVQHVFPIAPLLPGPNGPDSSATSEEGAPGAYIQAATVQEPDAVSAHATTVVAGDNPTEKGGLGKKAQPVLVDCPAYVVPLGGYHGGIVSRAHGCKGGILGGEESGNLGEGRPSSPAEDASHVSCGTVIPANATTTLDSDVGPCGGYGIVMTDGATLDLNGHRIFGPTVAAGLDEAGILFNGVQGAKVTDSTAVKVAGTWVSTNAVTLFDAGIAMIEDSSGNTIEKVNVVGNVGIDGDYGDGVHVRNSDGNRLVNNVISGNGPFSGVTLLDDSDSNVIQSNIIEDNQDSYHSPHDPEDIGVRLEVSHGNNSGCPDDNSITANRITANSLDGLSIMNGPACDSTGNNISANVVSGNGRDGIRLNGRLSGSTCYGAEQTLVSSNVVVDNGAAGIRVTSCAQNTEIHDNSVWASRPDVVPISPQLVWAPNGDLHDGNVNCGSNVWTGNQHVTEYASPGSTTGLSPLDYVCIE